MYTHLYYDNRIYYTKLRYKSTLDQIWWLQTPKNTSLGHFEINHIYHILFLFLNCSLEKNNIMKHRSSCLCSFASTKRRQHLLSSRTTLTYLCTTVYSIFQYVLSGNYLFLTSIMIPMRNSVITFIAVARRMP